MRGFERGRWWLLALGVGFEGGLAVLAWALGWLLDDPPFARLVWNAAAILQGTLATLPLLLVFALLMRSSHPAVVPLHRFIEEVVGALFGSCTLPELALI